MRYYKDRKMAVSSMTRWGGDYRLTLIAGVVAFAASSAHAHVLDEAMLQRLGDFGAGVSHPVLGADHFLAMFSVGVVSAILGGRHFWLVPLCFVATMPVGWMLGMWNIPFPPVEIGIASSVLVLGLAILAVRRLPVSAIYGAIVVFALFHGYAHGQETRPGINMLHYAAGFMTGTAAIHILGLFAGDLLSNHIRNKKLNALLATLIVLSGGYYVAVAIQDLAINI
jgi:urease accessory protein